MNAQSVLLKTLLLLLFSKALFSQTSSSTKVLSLDSIFEGNAGTFILFDQKENSYLLYNEKQANIAFPVHSTSKIIWSIIALEEKIICDENEIMLWDSIKYPRQAWWPEEWACNQTLVTALNKSVNWYFLELLKKIQPIVLEDYMKKLKYKEDYTVETNFYFALSSTIKKTAFEQLDFLYRLFNNQLPISPNTMAFIKKGMLLKSTDEYTFYYRTGLGPVDDAWSVGWYIGCVIKKEKAYYFALNVLNENEGKVSQLREKYIMKILSVLKII